MADRRSFVLGHPGAIMAMLPVKTQLEQLRVALERVGELCSALLERVEEVQKAAQRGE